MVWPTTRKSLLVRLRDGEEVAWGEFFLTYKRAIVRAGGAQLPESSWDDLLERVMLAVFNGGRFTYDRSRSRFRTWLKALVRNKRNDILRELYRDPRPEQDGEGSPALDTPVDPFGQRWDAEWQRHLLVQALEQLRSEVEPATYQAYDLVVLQEQSPQAAARLTGMTVGNVYVCKARCHKRLVGIVRAIEEST